MRISDGRISDGRISEGRISRGKIPESRICISIAEKGFVACKQALAKIAKTDLAEIRLDKAAISEFDIAKIFSSRKNLIATCRPSENQDQTQSSISDPSDLKRKTLLLAAISAGASYVDIELESNDRYQKELIAAAKKRGCKVIISYHDYQKTPSRAGLDAVVESCFDAGADIAKIACMVATDAAAADRDASRLLGLLDDKRKLVVIGMGERGRIVRIVAPLLGSIFAFVSPGKGKETALGQLTRNELVRVQGVLQKTLRQKTLRQEALRRVSSQ